MKHLSIVPTLVAPALLAGTLAGCGTGFGHEGQDAGSSHRSSVSQSPSGPIRGQGSSSGSSGSSGSTGSGSDEMASGMTSDPAAICALGRRIADERSPQERHALTVQSMPDMAPDMRKQQLETIRDSCQ